MLKRTILVASVAGLVLAVAPVAQAMEFVSIGDPKNPDDETPRGPYGGVPYEYRIGKYEVMIAEWEKSGLGDGDEAEWKKAVGPGAPAVNVTLHEAAQFANWMTKKYGGGNPYYEVDESGKMSIPTEDGNPISHYDWAVTKGKGTTYFIPTEDEWFKAAYYDPDKGDRGGYWEFPTGSDALPSPTTGGTAKGKAVFYFQEQPYRVDNAGCLSPYGTMAQGGNVWEWSENRSVRGGMFNTRDRRMRSSYHWRSGATSKGKGFRLSEVGPVPAGKVGPDVAAEVGPIPVAKPVAFVADPEAGRPFIPPAPKGDKWVLVWSDEFDGKEIDPAKWEIQGDWERRGGYWVKSDSYLDGEGHLVLRTRRQDDKFTCGAINTKGKYERRFGYFECRVKFPKEPGHWPAFWLNGEGVGGATNKEPGGRDGTEIDIFEKPYRDGRINHALHWDAYKRMATKHLMEVPGLQEGWHTVGVNWKPDEYVFYLDGKETWRTKAGGVSQVKTHILLTEEIGTWAGWIGMAKLPDETLFDYVRVYDLESRVK